MSRQYRKTFLCEQIEKYDQMRCELDKKLEDPSLPPLVD